MNRQQIIAEVSKVVNLLNGRRGFEGFAMPEIVFELNAGRVMGQTFSHKWTLDFNEQAAAVVGDEYRDIVLHEIAHLMVHHIYKGRNKQSHGPEFRMMCRIIGCTGSTYANPKVSAMIEVKRNNVSRVKYRCKCGAHYLTKQKSARIAGRGASCSHCKAKIEYVSSVVVPSNHPYFVKGE